MCQLNLIQVASRLPESQRDLQDIPWKFHTRKAGLNASRRERKASVRFLELHFLNTIKIS